MKATLALTAALGLLAWGGTPAVAETRTPTAGSVLAVGSSGSSVSHVQQQLRTLGFFTYSTNTGYYGTVSQSAVRSFQRAFGLATDGIAGPITRQALNRAVTIKQLAQDAVRYTGVPYRWGGTTPSGFDCSGFIWYLYQKHGLSLSRLTSQAYYKMGTRIDRAHLQPGDLVFFNIAGTASHVGIYQGGGKWISATSSKGIWTYTMDNPYWARYYGGARRI